MLDNFLAVHENSLKIRSFRTKLLASNIANADTPNYKAKDIAFAEVLRNANATSRTKKSLAPPTAPISSLLVTNQKHISKSTQNLSPKIMYRQPEQASLDGNSVDKDLEQARFAENAVRYQASLQFINSRISGLIRTLRGE